jgi:dolichol-phosphate mannosyltransferase
VNKLNIALLVPTYNEAGNIERLIEAIAYRCQQQNHISLELFVLDDNSPDHTAEIVKRVGRAFATEQFCVQVIERPKKEGLGKAYIDGFQYVLAQQRFDYILQMDADLSHDPVYLAQFFSSAQRGVELTVASRYLAGASIPDWSWYRRFLSQFGNRFARFVLGSQVSDYTGGFNMYSTRVIKQIDLNGLAVAGYGFLIKLKFLASQKALCIEQFPIHFLDRQTGQSKMPLNTLFKNFFLVLSLWRYKQKKYNSSLLFFFRQYCWV